MKRASVLSVIVSAGVMSIALAASQQPAAPAGQQGARVVEVQKLKDNLFVLTGGGGNTAVFVQTNGVAVVDTKNPGWGQPILDKIKELTDKPVTTIINTHTHGDHVSGNVEFPATVEVVTHENTKANMEKMASPPGFPPPATPQPNIFSANNGRGMPKRTFTDGLSIGAGADQIDLYYFGRGHTNGDTMIVFPAHRVMHMGDLFPGKQIPIMDSNNGGSGVEYSDTLKKTHDGVPNVDTIITGHSTQMSPKDLLEYSEFIRDFVDAVRAAKNAGQTPEQVAASWKVPEKYAGYAAPAAPRLRANIETIFKELP
jgi:glyoxylase-like metal-dependent hydrolase (beta-lactamase superfamily II)